MSASTSLFKQNGGLNYERKSWTEYPATGKKWRDNWDRTFGKGKQDDKPETDDKVGPYDLNPGSEEAQKAGCICPVLDNEFGRGFPYGGSDGPCFYITEGCPIHSPKCKTPQTSEEEPEA